MKDFQEVSEFVAVAIAEEYRVPRDSVKITDVIAEAFNADSIQRQMLVGAIETHFGISIDPLEAHSVRTVQDLVQLVELTINKQLVNA